MMPFKPGETDLPSPLHPRDDFHAKAEKTTEEVANLDESSLIVENVVKVSESCVETQQVSEKSTSQDHPQIEKPKSKNYISKSRRSGLEVVLRKRVTKGSEVKPYEKPSLQVILKNVDDFHRRVESGKAKILSPEEGDRQFAAILKKQQELKDKYGL